MTRVVISLLFYLTETLRRVLKINSHLRLNFGSDPNLIIQRIRRIPTGLSGQIPFDRTWHGSNSIQLGASARSAPGALVDHNSCCAKQCEYIKPSQAYYTFTFVLGCVFGIMWAAIHLICKDTTEIHISPPVKLRLPWNTTITLKIVGCR